MELKDNSGFISLLKIFEFLNKNENLNFKNEEKENKLKGILFALLISSFINTGVILTKEIFEIFSNSKSTDALTASKIF